MMYKFYFIYDNLNISKLILLTTNTGMKVIHGGQTTKMYLKVFTMFWLTCNETEWFFLLEKMQYPTYPLTIKDMSTREQYYRTFLDFTEKESAKVKYL